MSNSLSSGGGGWAAQGPEKAKQAHSDHGLKPAASGGEPRAPSGMGASLQEVHRPRKELLLAPRAPNGPSGRCHNSPGWLPAQGYSWGGGSHRVEQENRDELHEAVEGHVLEDDKGGDQGAAAFPAGNGGASQPWGLGGGAPQEDPPLRQQDGPRRPPSSFDRRLAGSPGSHSFRAAAGPTG